MSTPFDSPTGFDEVLESCFFILDSLFGDETMERSEYPLYVEPADIDMESMHYVMGAMKSTWNTMDKFDVHAGTPVLHSDRVQVIQFEKGIKVAIDRVGEYFFCCGGGKSEDSLVLRQRLAVCVEAFQLFCGSVANLKHISQSREDLQNLFSSEGQILSPRKIRDNPSLEKRVEAGYIFSLPRLQIPARSRRYFVETMVAVDRLVSFAHVEGAAVFSDKDSTVVSTMEVNETWACLMRAADCNWYRTVATKNKKGRSIDVYSKLFFRREDISAQQCFDGDVSLIERNFEQACGCSRDADLLRAHLENPDEEGSRRIPCWFVLIPVDGWKLVLILDAKASVMQAVKSNMIDRVLNLIGSVATKLYNSQSSQMAASSASITSRPSLTDVYEEQEEENGQSIHIDYTSSYLKSAFLYSLPRFLVECLLPFPFLIIEFIHFSVRSVRACTQIACFLTSI
uniref:Uncharacterized protein n=1 Tax=Palpitomonas bilix TaxID=652834 RepID=A0A7S3DHZ3_9EUKA|mmetsp:Transcript_38041/g.98220  ORF Transcript_38041/g.98220 Transcript_38041/m.98220 type:complete len:455 (+) Transcript_38041:197-1561(+)